MNKNNRKIVNNDEYLLKYGPNKNNVKDKIVDNFNVENIYYDNFHEEPLDKEINGEIWKEIILQINFLNFFFRIFIYSYN